MIIFDSLPTVPEKDNDRYGALLAALQPVIINREDQHATSKTKLQTAIGSVNSALTSASADITALVNAHQAKRGAQHGETAGNMGLGRLKNWRSSVLGDLNYPPSDHNYLTSDVALAMAKTYVKTDFSNFMAQGVLPLAYFRGAQLTTWDGLNTVSSTSLSLSAGPLLNINDNGVSNTLAINGTLVSGSYLRNVAYPMQPFKRVNVFSNNNKLFIACPSDKNGELTSPVDKMFVSSELNEDNDFIVSEIGDQPFTVRTIGWGGESHLTQVNGAATAAILFGKDYYFGQQTPIPMTLKSGGTDYINYATIPGSPLFGNISKAGSIRASHEGISLTLADCVYDGVKQTLTINDAPFTNLIMTKVVNTDNSTDLTTNTVDYKLSVKDASSTLRVKDTYNVVYNLVVGMQGKGMLIPWDNLINYLGVDRKVQLIDFSTVDPYYDYGTLIWETPGSVLLAYVDGVMQFANQGNPIRKVFRLGFRITLGATNVIQLIEGIDTATFDDTGISDSGNMLYNEVSADPFHPIYGRGQFLATGGHVSGMTRSTEIVLLNCKHRFTTLADYIKGYWLNTEYTYLEYPVYPANRISGMNASSRRCAPVRGSNSEISYLVTTPTVKGAIHTTGLRWGNGVLYVNPADDGEYIIQGGATDDTLSNVVNLPRGILSVISTTNLLSVSSLIYGSAFNNAGVDSYTVTTDFVPNKAWTLDPSLITLLSNYGTGFLTKARALYTSNGIVGDTAQQSYQWMVVMRPTSASGATVTQAALVLTDSCGVIGYVPLSITANAATLVFSTTMTSAQLDTALKLSMTSTPVFSVDSDPVDKYFDCVLATESNGKVYLLVNRAFGFNGGGCLISLTDNTINTVTQPHVESSQYPTLSEYSITGLGVPAKGAFVMTNAADGVLQNGSKTLSIDYYTSNVITSIKDTDGVNKYVYTIPEGLTFIVAGYQFTLDSAMSALYPITDTCYLYLVLGNSGITVVASAVQREPSIFEVYYGRGIGGLIGVTSTAYCVLDGYLLSEQQVGSAIPFTAGKQMDPGSMLWNLKHT